MTAEKWEEVKLKEEFGIDICFDYYQEKGGLVDFTQFQRIFPQLIAQGTPLLNSEGKPVILNFENIYHKIFSRKRSKRLFGFN